MDGAEILSKQSAACGPDTLITATPAVTPAPEDRAKMVSSWKTVCVKLTAGFVYSCVVGVSCLVETAWISSFLTDLLLCAQAENGRHRTEKVLQSAPRLDRDERDGTLASLVKKKKAIDLHASQEVHCGT